MSNYTKYFPNFFASAMVVAIGVGLPLYFIANAKGTNAAQVHHARPAAISTQYPSCRGPPNIQHLFDAYDGLASIVAELPISTPSIDRLRAWGDRERREADDLYRNCKMGLERTLAEIHAITAINAITEAKHQQFDMYMPGF